MIISKIINTIRNIFFHQSSQISTAPSKSINKNFLIEALRKADVISFDIFDTLITRRIYSPEDIFSIIEQKYKLDHFKEKRIQADSIARKQLGRDINLDDIYTVLQSSFNAKKLTRAKEFEQQLEIEFCIPRTEILEIFRSLIAERKTVILVSDMYLASSTIKAMLKKCGYIGYQKLYLSNDLNARKDTKTIWQFVRQDYPHQKIVHIGDNRLSDITYPKEFSIDTIEIPSGKTLAKQSSINQYMGDSPNNIDDSIFWGTIINGFLFNSPFTPVQYIGNLSTLGYLFYGPIFDAFFAYITSHTTSKDQLLFLSREGYYLQKLYLKYAKLSHLTPLKNYYFLASRRATTFANFNSADDIIKFTQSNYYQGSLANWFSQLLDITIDLEDSEDPVITLPADLAKIQPYITKYAPKIIQQSCNAKTNYIAYIKQTVGKLNKTTKLIDLGYSGTIQYELSKMLKRDLCGIYLASSEHIKQLSPSSRLSFLFDTRQNPTYKKIYEYSLVLEFFLSAPQGQLIGFKKGGKPFYNNETLNSAKKATIQEIKCGTEKYLSDITKIKDLIPSYSISTEALLQFYTFCIEQNIITKSIKDKFDFTDNFTTDETKNVFKIISKY